MFRSLFIAPVIRVFAPTLLVAQINTGTMIGEPGDPLTAGVALRLRRK